MYAQCPRAHAVAAGVVIYFQGKDKLATMMEPGLKFLTSAALTSSFFFIFISRIDYQSHE